MAIDLRERVRDVPDWPEQGVVFRDITPLLRDREALDQTVHELAAWGKERTPDVVLGAEARGFILGAAIAREIGSGFVPARRPGKLPPETVGATYALEYGKNTLELHPETIRTGDRVLIHDDVLATGGTVEAIAGLVEGLGAEVVGVAFIIELTFLGGRERLQKYDFHSLITYQIALGLIGRVRTADYKETMYDHLTTRYTFACPQHGAARVALSSFRRLERLPGASHPAVFRIGFECGCGDEHPGLVTHEELDWLPLGLGTDVSFVNLMTDRLEALEVELAELAASRIGAGQWPWSFFCYPENRPRPVFPSSFFLLAPSASQGAIGLAVRCPTCGSTSINVVSEQHVDLPFHNDTEIGVVDHVFEADADRVTEEFAAELNSAQFDARRLAL